MAAYMIYGTKTLTCENTGLKVMGYLYRRLGDFMTNHFIKINDKFPEYYIALCEENRYEFYMEIGINSLSLYNNNLTTEKYISLEREIKNITAEFFHITKFVPYPISVVVHHQKDSYYSLYVRAKESYRCIQIIKGEYQQDCYLKEIIPVNNIDTTD